MDSALIPAEPRTARHTCSWMEYRMTQRPPGRPRKPTTQLPPPIPPPRRKWPWLLLAIVVIAVGAAALASGDPSYSAQVISTSDTPWGDRRSGHGESALALPSYDRNPSARPGKTDISGIPDIDDPTARTVRRVALCNCCSEGAWYENDAEGEPAQVDGD